MRRPTHHLWALIIASCALASWSLASCSTGVPEVDLAKESTATATAEPTVKVAAPVPAAELSGIPTEPPIVSDADLGPALESDIDTSQYFDGVLPRLTPTPVPDETPEPAPTPVPSCEAFTLPGVDFDSGDDTLSPEARDTIGNFYAAKLSDSGPQDNLLIAGHTDSRPFDGPGGNQGLSERRAEAVASELRNLGLDPGVTVETIGHSDRFQVAEGDAPEALALNRRVEVFVECR